jgi:hypothetical protein
LAGDGERLPIIAARLAYGEEIARACGLDLLRPPYRSFSGQFRYGIEM